MFKFKNFLKIQADLYALLTVLLFNALAQNRFEPLLTQRIDSIICSHLEKDHFAGAVIQISWNHKIILSKPYGFAQKFELINGNIYRIDEPEPLTVDHLFDLASLTKVFATTFGIMLLVDQNKININDPVNKFLKEFSGDGKDSITIKHLLNHTSGLTEWLPIYYHARKKEDVYNYICKLPLKYKVGQERHYSDLGFILLGFLIEKVSGLSLDEFLKRNLYQPLGLTKTCYNPLSNGIPRNLIAATSHGNPYEKKMIYDVNFGYKVEEEQYPDKFKDWREYTLRGEVNDGNCFYALGGISGHAGLFSCVKDLQVLVDLLMNYGEYQGKRYIKSETVRLFTENGLGWSIIPNTINAPDTLKAFGHTGFTGTWTIMVPKYNLSIILLTNRQNTGVNRNGQYYDIRKMCADILRECLLTLPLNHK